MLFLVWLWLVHVVIFLSEIFVADGAAGATPRGAEKAKKFSSREGTLTEVKNFYHSFPRAGAANSVSK
jgi:hypothetical protein